MDQAKSLGVDINKDLSYNTHINRISTNANRTLGLLKKNIKTKHTAIRTAAHQTLVRPQVDYASTVWSPFTQSKKISDYQELLQSDPTSCPQKTKGK